MVVIFYSWFVQIQIETRSKHCIWLFCLLNLSLFFSLNFFFFVNGIDTKSHIRMTSESLKGKPLTSEESFKPAVSLCRLVSFNSHKTIMLFSRSLISGLLFLGVQKNVYIFQVLRGNSCMEVLPSVGSKWRSGIRFVG